MLSAAASLGLIHLWDVHGGLTPIDKYLYTSEEYIKVNTSFLFTIIYIKIYQIINLFLTIYNIQAGALLALGIVNVGVRNECDPAYSLLSDYVLHESVLLRIGAVLGKNTIL